MIPKRSYWSKREPSTDIHYTLPIFEVQEIADPLKTADNTRAGIFMIFSSSIHELEYIHSQRLFHVLKARVGFSNFK